MKQKKDISRGSNCEKWKVPKIPEKCSESPKLGMGNILICISILRRKSAFIR